MEMEITGTNIARTLKEIAKARGKRTLALCRSGEHVQ